MTGKDFLWYLLVSVGISTMVFIGGCVLVFWSRFF